MIAVLDTGVVVSGIFWKAETHQCVIAFARRKFILAVTDQIFEEYVDVAWRLKQDEELPIDPEPWLAFIRDKGRFCVPLRLDNPVCRDRKDDIFLECALAASATVIVSRDEDLLALGKPFGVTILTPRQFLSVLRRR